MPHPSPRRLWNLSPPDPAACYPPDTGSDITQNQRLDPDRSPVLLAHRERDGRGRFAKGSSGNPKGRPHGIPNPPHRIPNFLVRPVNPAALDAVLDRKPALARLALGLILPRAREPAPAVRLGIALAALRTPDACLAALNTVLAGMSHGVIGPAEAVRVAKKIGRRLGALRRGARSVNASVDGRGQHSLDPIPRRKRGLT